MAQGMLVPFYHVIDTTIDGEANMVWDTWSDPLVESELEITCIKNKRAVKKNELLKVFKVPVPKAEKHTKPVIKESPSTRARTGASSASSSTAVEPARAQKLRKSVEAAAEVADASNAKGAGKGTGKDKGKGKGKGAQVNADACGDASAEGRVYGIMMHAGHHHAIQV
jgi:hypothetical protein